MKQRKRDAASPQADQAPASSKSTGTSNSARIEQMKAAKGGDKRALIRELFGDGTGSSGPEVDAMSIEETRQFVKEHFSEGDAPATDPAAVEDMSIEETKAAILELFGEEDSGVDSPVDDMSIEETAQAARDLFGE